jgi:hypothetical protein
MALVLSALVAPLHFAAAAQPSATVVDNEVLLDAYDEAMASRRYQDALEAARKVQFDNPEGEAVVTALQASALLGLKRDAEADKLIARIDQLAPSSTDALGLLFGQGVILDRPQVAADALD